MGINLSQRNGSRERRLWHSALRDCSYHLSLSTPEIRDLEVPDGENFCPHFPNHYDWYTMRRPISADPNRFGAVMAKKAKKSRTPIQFRPGDASAPLQEFADAQDLSINDAAKKLVVLALNNLGYVYCDVIEDLAEAMPGEQSFSQACSYFAFRLQEAELNRKSKKEPPMSEKDKLELARLVISGFDFDFEKNNEKRRQRVKIHRTLPSES